MVCRVEVRVDDHEVIGDAAEKDLGQVQFQSGRIGGGHTQKRQSDQKLFRPADCAVPHGVPPMFFPIITAIGDVVPFDHQLPETWRLIA